jgi:hypothetical protein
VLAVLWPMSGFPVPGAIIATLGSAAALWLDEGYRGRSAEGGVGYASPLLGGIAAMLIAAALALTPLRELEPPAPARTAALPAAPTPAATPPPAPADAAPAIPLPADDAPVAPAIPEGVPAAPPSAEAPATPAEGTTPDAEVPVTGGDEAPARPGEDAPATPVEAAPVEEAPPAENPPVTLEPQPLAPAAGTADATVQTFYTDLDARRFKSAWRLLSPAVQQRFGGFTAWKRGYGNTVSSRPVGLRLKDGGDGTASLRHTLVAVDRTPCGKQVEQRFAVTWQLAAGPDGWQAADLSAVKLSGPDPKRACA